MIRPGKRISNKPSLPSVSATINKISVNLLPQEIILQRKQGSKLNIVSKVSIITLVIFVFLTSVTLALRISQSFDLNSAKNGLVRAEGQVNSLKGPEQQAIVLKQRLSSIKALLGGDSKRKEIFNLVVYLTPADIMISEVTVDKNSNMSLTLQTSNLASIETFLSSLGDEEKNSGLIKKVTLEGLSLGRDSIFRFTLKILPKS
ncbi:MAG: hypothetical protein V1808_02660 [Candidatus Daviesbacteria bacterium]